MRKNIPFASFENMHAEIRRELDAAYRTVMDRSYFIQGKACEQFEREFAGYCGTDYCIVYRNRFGGILCGSKAGVC